MNTTNYLPEGGLLQSDVWAQVVRGEGGQVVDVTLRASHVYCTLQRLPFTMSYLYVARFVPSRADHLGHDMAHVCTAGTAHGCSWVRIDIGSQEMLAALCGAYPTAVAAPHDMQPRENFIMDITPSPDELLAQMKSKTRYNIRLALKKGVEVTRYTFGDDGFDEALQAFHGVILATAQRKGVQFHSFAHYREMFTHLPQGVISLYVARYAGEVVAANILTVYGGVGTYLHGATSDAHRRVMAPFLLQWQMMQDAQTAGCTAYDFGGYYSESEGVERTDGQRGISRFKSSFSPHTVPTRSYGSWDIPLAPLRYRAYRMLQKIKSLM